MSRLPDYLCVVKRKNREESDYPVITTKPQKYYLAYDAGESEYYSFSIGCTDAEVKSMALYETVLVSHAGGILKAPAFENELVRLIYSGEIIMRPCATCKHKMLCLVDHTHVVTYEKEDEAI